MAADHTNLFDAIRNRPAGADGVSLASKYVDSFKLQAGDQGIESGDEQPFAYYDPESRILGGLWREGRSWGRGKKGRKARAQATAVEGACMVFDAVVLTSRKDRDGDILEPVGAVVDPSHPLLWQHVPAMPIGKHLAVLKQDQTIVIGSYAIADTELGRDAAQLVEFGALRISHGFRPLEFEPLKRKDVPDPLHPEQGWHIKRFEVLEASLVSVPSNVGAVITAFSRQKLHHPLIKSWAGGLAAARPVQVVGGWAGEPVKGQDGKVTIHGSYQLAGVTKMMWQPYIDMPAFKGSYQWTTEKLTLAARTHLTETKVAVQPQDDICLLATYSDQGVLCVIRNQRGQAYGDVPGLPMEPRHEFYRCTWATGESDKPAWNGTPERVELTATVLEVAKAMAAQYLKAGRAVSAKNRQAIQESHDLFDETATHTKTTTAHKEKCSAAMKSLKAVMGECEEDGADAEKATRSKAGRVLSKENMAKVKEAHGAACEMADDAEMHRAGKAMMREAKSHLMQVMGGAGETGEENPEVTGKPNPGIEKGLSLNDHAGRVVGGLLKGEALSPGVACALVEVVEDLRGQLPEMLAAALNR